MVYNRDVLFLVLLTVPMASQKNTEVTLSINERVNLLKFQIAKQIRHKQKASLLIKPIDDDIEDNYEYVELDDKPITPIMDNDERKFSNKYKLRELATTKTTVSEEEEIKPVQRMRPKNKKGKEHHSHLIQPLETFYRRVMGEEWIETTLPNLHCQDLITPFFTGLKKDFTKPKIRNSNDLHIKRFIHLINLNTTGYSKDEMYSVLYQVSNIQIRIFQWDVSAITLMLNALIKGKPHTLQHLRYSVRDLLRRWHMDLHNATNLLKQAKIFRPPCVRTSEYGGSTKNSRGLRYPKTTTAKTTCETRDSDDN